MKKKSREILELRPNINSQHHESNYTIGRHRSSRRRKWLENKSVLSEKILPRQSKTLCGDQISCLYKAGGFKFEKRHASNMCLTFEE